jgi:hypothetical protein
LLQKDWTKKDRTSILGQNHPLDSTKKLKSYVRGKLGRVLAEVERQQGKHTLSGRQIKFRDLLKQVGLDKQLALETQHIGAMPERLSAAAAAGVLQ